MDGIKILGSTWFTQMAQPQTIGKVIIENEVKKQKAYIGSGNGYDQKLDEESIASFGAKFPLDLAKQMIGI